MTGDGGARRSAREAARSALLSGAGVIVVGDPGSGRTAFVEQVSATLPPELRDRLWIGEDLHGLGRSEAVKLARAIETNRVLAFGTSSNRRPLESTLVRLCREGSVVRVDLPPLPPAEMLDAVEADLGGPLDIDSVPVFVPRKDGGDLVLLHEFVRAARVSGALELRETRWHFGGLAPSAELRHTVHSRLHSDRLLDDSEMQILDVLALAPETKVQELVEIVGSPHTDELLELLEGEGVIDAVRTDGEVRLRVHDPVAELVLPHTVGLLRRSRLCARIVDCLESHPVESLAAVDLATLARLAIPLGRAVDPRALVRAASVALTASRFDLALGLGQAAALQGGGAQAEVVLAAAESQLGWQQRARDRLDALVGQELTDTGRAQLTALRELIVSRIGDTTFGWQLPSNRAPADSVDLEMLLRVAHFDHGSDSSRDHQGPAQAVLEGERLAHAATMATLAGNLTQALHYLDQAEQMLASVGADLFVVTLRRAYAGAMLGQTAQSIRIFEDLRDRSTMVGRPDQFVIAAWCQGQWLLHAGQAPAAISALESAAATARAIGMERSIDLIRPDLATAYALAGDVEKADLELAPVVGAALDDFGGATLPVQARGWILAQRGRRAEAVDAFIAAGDVHLEFGHHSTSIVAYLDAARAGAASRVVEHVGHLATLLDGDYAELFLRSATALASFQQGPRTEPEDAELAQEFVALGEALSGFSLHLRAAEAFSFAAVLGAHPADSRSAAGARRRMAEELAVCGLSTSPFLATNVAPTDTGLSFRESQVAVLARAGQSNREIAESLVLSVRTVETHLLRVYKKLGIRNRSEIAEALHDSRPEGAPAALTGID